MKNNRSEFYTSFLKYARLFQEDKYTHTYEFIFEGTKCLVTTTKKKANKRTVIHCRGKKITWEQLPYCPRLIGNTFGETRAFYQFSNLEPDVIYIFVIMGKITKIHGLDEGIFCCATRQRKGRFVFVMSQKAFSKFSLM